MNLLDIIIVVILGFCVIRGFFRGIVKELSSIIGVLGGFYAGYTYYRELGILLAKWISNTAYLNILSFAIIFCGVFAFILILAVIIKYLLKIASLGWIDHVGGTGFGFVKGILLSAVLLFVLTAFLPKGVPFIKNSLLSPHVTVVSEKMAKVVPKNLKSMFSVKIDELKKKWEIGK